MTSACNVSNMPDMSDTPRRLVGFRLPADLLERLDAYLDHVRRSAPGASSTRTAVCLEALRRGLTSMERERERRSK